MMSEAHASTNFVVHDDSLMTPRTAREVEYLSDPR